MKRRAFITGVVVCLVSLILWVFTLNTWAPHIAQFLILNETPRRSDIIIIPSGTDAGGRIRHGVTLYKNGYAPMILLSGTFDLWKETGVDLMKIYAISLGVPERDILVDHDSGSTVENAIFAKEIVKKNRCRSVLIATSPAHSRRTKMVFQKFFPKEIQVTVTCDASTFDAARWWKTPAMAREVFHEFFAFLYYGLFGYPL